ncbi:siderophore ABC transporter substrate-binding protein [uncultured Roseovarius sp.]|uniref:siderophore ABC transporter substrate-binding protein n=1 Tax=uncultured Roseovarius sp. TaxID=293344 RepID=UPI002627597E|nr:siderophore ABC transporter substrate-binding protein [uncultured Roseovarius sp.]
MKYVFAFALALLSTPLAAQEVTIDTYAGLTTLPASPQKIAVFDLAALDTLAALGVTPDGVISPTYLPHLDRAAEGAEPVGSLFEPDFEAVNALQPDLIIAGGRSQEHVPTLSNLAPTIDMTIWEDTIGQGLERLTAYGTLFGKEAEAAALRATFEDKLDRTRTATADQGKTLVIMTNGPKVTAYGASGRFGWLYSGLGLQEAVADVETTTHGEAISFEFIREANPDVLLVVDRLGAIGADGDRAQVTLDNALVHDTAAWKSGKVIYLNAGAVYIAGGGIQSMTLVLDDVLAALSIE